MCLVVFTRLPVCGCTLRRWFPLSFQSYPCKVQAVLDVLLSFQDNRCKFVEAELLSTLSCVILPQGKERVGVSKEVREGWKSVFCCLAAQPNGKLICNMCPLFLYAHVRIYGMFVCRWLQFAKICVFLLCVWCVFRSPFQRKNGEKLNWQPWP